MGLECVRYHAQGLMTRDFGQAPGGRLDGGDYWVLDTRLVTEIATPQGVFNHWGLDLSERLEVEVAYAAAIKFSDYFGLASIGKLQVQHGAYSFYFSDIFHNWWEIGCHHWDTEERESQRVRFMDPEDHAAVPRRFFMRSQLTGAHK